MTFFGKNFLSDWWFLVSSLLYFIHKFSRTFKIHQMVLFSIRVDAKKWTFSCFEITFYLMVKRKIRFDRNWRCHRPFPYSELFWSEFFFFFPHSDWIRGDTSRIFPHLDWIRRDTEYLPVFSPNAGKYWPEKTPYLGHSRSVYSSKYQFCKYRMGYIWKKLSVKHLNWRRDTNISREVFRAIIFKKKFILQLLIL